MIDRILIVDDEFLIRDFMTETVRRHGVEVSAAASGEEAVELLRQEPFQMAFVDLKMSGMSGIDVLRFASEHCPEMLFVIVTAYGTIETAVEAMRIGAYDFMIKPISPDQVGILIEKGRKWLGMDRQRAYLQQELVAAPAAGEGELDKRIIGSSPALRKVGRLVKRVAPTDATVLITGESGTGKELIASEIHRMSDPGNKKPYVRMNCAAVPETLLESELFGHEKGAFTSACERRVGRFELADGGTLLLDEIGEISLNMQAKLLRVLQESEFERVGSSRTIKVNVRVITTTNRDLEAEVQESNFRSDLYYRLNVFPIHLPPLRERGRDVVEIARIFLDRQSRKLRRPLQFSEDALEALTIYPWPGNIRELENVIERVAILEDGPEITAEALPLDLTGSESPHQVGVRPEEFKLRDIEKETIRRALHRTQGNRSRAADLLGFTTRTLRNKLHEYRQNDEIDDTWAVE